MPSYLPGTSNAYPDITGGQQTQTNGDPALPGTYFQGPVVVGIWSSDGTNNLAGVGGTIGTANAGYVRLAQSCVINQATNNGATAQFVCPIVIPAQSQIVSMKLMVTTVWVTTTNLGVGIGGTATYFTAANAVTGLNALGQVSIVPGTSLTQIANWDNTGTQDVQIVILSGATGTGVGTFTVEYIPGINLAS